MPAAPLFEHSRQMQVLKAGERFPPLLNNETIRAALNLWKSNKSQCTLIYGHISAWNVSHVTNMDRLFHSYHSFNQNISKWNVSAVRSMECMFYGCTSFDQPIGTWNVSSVQNMNKMFGCCRKFNQYLGDWDVSSVTNFAYMFWKCAMFNQNIGNWNVSSAMSMECMFCHASSFNQSVSNWNVSSTCKKKRMFFHCINFSQPFGHSWSKDCYFQSINSLQIFSPDTKYYSDQKTLFASPRKNGIRANSSPLLKYPSSPKTSKFHADSSSSIDTKLMKEASNRLLNCALQLLRQIKMNEKERNSTNAPDHSFFAIKKHFDHTLHSMPADLSKLDEMYDYKLMCSGRF